MHLALSEFPDEASASQAFAVLGDEPWSARLSGVELILLSESYPAELRRLGASAGQVFNVAQLFGSWTPTAPAQLEALIGQSAEPPAVRDFTGLQLFLCDIDEAALERASSIQRAHVDHIVAHFGEMPFAMQLTPQESWGPAGVASWKALYAQGVLDGTDPTDTFNADPYTAAGVWSAVRSVRVLEHAGAWRPRR